MLIIFLNTVMKQKLAKELKYFWNKKITKINHVYQNAATIHFDKSKESVIRFCGLCRPASVILQEFGWEKFNWSQNRTGSFIQSQIKTWIKVRHVVQYHITE